MMTTYDGRSNDQPLWRRVATAAAVFIAATAVATATATTADAKPKKAGLDQYSNCIRAQLNSINQDWSKIPNDAVRTALSNCCTGLGGIYNENTNECYLPNGDVAEPPNTNPPPPPPGTAILPGDVPIQQVE